jgi:AraC-like DNA-binding protein
MLAVMGAVTSLFARKMVAAAGEAVDRTAPLRSVGIDPDCRANPASMVSADAYYGLLERIAEQIDATELPLRTGRSMASDDYGAFGLAWKAAPTLRDSFARAERYARLLSSVVEYEVCAYGGGAYFMLHRSGPRRLGMRLSNEATLASVVSISREVSGDAFAPLEVHLKHRAPKTTAHHERYFGCSVMFDSDRDALLVSTDALNRPNKLGDEGITRFLLRHLEEEMKKLAHDKSIEQLIKDSIARSLSDGPPKMDDVARRLGMSVRSLQRRLAEDSLSFQTLAEATRRELAEGLLVDGRYSIAEIAFLTGFAEQSSFTRAFKRWAGRTPASYRRDSPTG